MHPVIARRVIFPLMQWKDGGQTGPLLKALERSEGLSLDALLVLQRERLTRLLDHAYRRAPYYRELFHQHGLRPSDVSRLEDLDRLPVLPKETVRDRGPSLMAEGAGERLIERRTSGSTGIPLVVYVAPATRDAWGAAARRTQRWWGLQIGMRRIKLINPRGKATRTLRRQEWLMNHAEHSVFELDEPSLERLYQRAVRFRCEILGGYPSALVYFAQYVATRGAGRLALRAIATTAEVLFPDQQQLLERVFGCPVINEYGSSECGFLAGTCPSGSLHIAAENAVVEFVPVAGDQGGEACELIVTDLTNTAMPLIRYRIGDLGAPGDPCACGRALPVLRLRVGRTEDLVTLPDGRKVDGAVFGQAVEELVERGVLVKQFRAIQHTLDHVEVLIALDGADPAVPDQLAGRLRELLGARLTITVRPVPHIPVERSGKLRRFVSLVNARSA